MEVFLNNSSESLLVEIFSHYSNLVARKKVNIIRLSNTALHYMESGEIRLPTLPALIAPEQILSDPISICSYMADLSFTRDILIPQNYDVQVNAAWIALLDESHY